MTKKWILGLVFSPLVPTFVIESKRLRGVGTDLEDTKFSLKDFGFRRATADLLLFDKVITETISGSSA